MKQYFAQQHRVGGAYYRQRFQKDQPHYKPEWLTNAGSVSVLESIDLTKTVACLEDWLLTGLPPSDAEQANWETTPYIAEHGYGEIRVNLPPTNCTH